MIRFWEGQIVHTITIVIGLVFPVAVRSQALTAKIDAPPQCTKADLAIHFGFFESPKSYDNLVIQGRNISGHVCTFESSLFDPRFSGSTPPFKCEDCAKREREGYRDDSVATASYVVRPGEIAQRQYRWRRTPENASIRCFHPDGMESAYSFTWTLATPSLMKEVCSDISLVDTDLLARRSDADAEMLWTNELGGKLTLTAVRRAYYIDEAFPLVVSHRYPVHAAVDPAKCPPLFIWHRSADGTVRVKERTPTGSCQTIDVSFQPNKVFSSSDWNSAEAKRLSNYGDQQLQAFQQVDRGEDRHVHFYASDILTVRIEGSDDTSLRKWSRLKGIAADILLDRDTYEVGEDIPLHLAIANFDATDSIYSWDPVWDPCVSVGIEVLDDTGDPIPASDRFLYPPILCSGHGLGPSLFTRGKISSLEWSLKQTGRLPKRPGIYTVVLSWRTSTGEVSDMTVGDCYHSHPSARI